MKQFKVPFAIGLSLLFIALPKASATVINEIPSYAELRKTSDTTDGYNLHDISYADIRKKIYKNFDCRCLSSPKTYLMISVYFSPQGVPAYKLIRTEHATPADEFYCEQAIWETVLVPGPYRREIVLEFQGLPNGLSRDNQYGEHPEFLNQTVIRNWQKASLESDSVRALEDMKGRDRKSVKLHIIPAVFPADALMPLGSVSSPDNVVKLSTKKLNDPRLKEFRLEARNIGEAPTSYSNIVAKAKILQKKYADLFS